MDLHRNANYKIKGRGWAARSKVKVVEMWRTLTPGNEKPWWSCVAGQDFWCLWSRQEGDPLLGLRTATYGRAVMGTDRGGRQQSRLAKGGVLQGGGGDTRTILPCPLHLAVDSKSVAGQSTSSPSTLVISLPLQHELSLTAPLGYTIDIPLTVVLEKDDQQIRSSHTSQKSEITRQTSLQGRQNIAYPPDPALSGLTNYTKYWWNEGDFSLPPTNCSDTKIFHMGSSL